MGLIDVKSSTITSKGQIVIPKSLRESLGLEDGSKIAVFAYSDRIEIRPFSKIKDISSAILSEKSLAKNWNTKEEDNAWKNL